MKNHKTRILIYLDTSGNDVPINSDIHHKGISCCQVAFIMNVLLGMRTWSKIKRSDSICMLYVLAIHRSIILTLFSWTDVDVRAWLEWLLHPIDMYDLLHNFFLPLLKKITILVSLTCPFSYCFLLIDIPSYHCWKLTTDCMEDNRITSYRILSRPKYLDWLLSIISRYSGERWGDAKTCLIEIFVTDVLSCFIAEIGGMCVFVWNHQYKWPLMPHTFTYISMPLHISETCSDNVRTNRVFLFVMAYFLCGMPCCQILINLPAEDDFD